MSEICGFSHKCVLCSDMCVKPSRLLLKEFLILCCVFLSTCLPSPMHTHSFAHSYTLQCDSCTKRSLLWLFREKKNPCLPRTVGMKNSLSFHEQHRKPNSSGGRLAGCSCNLFLCVFMSCFVFTNQRAVPLLSDFLKHQEEIWSTVLRDWPWAL